MGILGAVPQPTTGGRLPATWVLARPSSLLEHLHSPGSAGGAPAPSAPADPLLREGPLWSYGRTFPRARLHLTFLSPGPPQLGARHRRGLETDPQALHPDCTALATLRG